MTSYSEAEKIAGRRFRDDAQAKLSATFDRDAPTHIVPTYLGIYRHDCPAARAGRTTALELKEMYVPSPEYTVTTDDGSHSWVAPGRFAFIYRQGRCRSCGATARSDTGRLVDGWARPPIHAASHTPGADHERPAQG
jgi:hypothetical protein